MDAIQNLRNWGTQISEIYGTGMLKQDLIFVLVALIFLFALIGTFAFLRRSRSSNMPKELERLSGLAGRVERFEMSSNTVRTEIQRDIEFLKSRVEKLEAQISELRSDQSARELVESAYTHPGAQDAPFGTDEGREQRRGRERKDTSEYGVRREEISAETVTTEVVEKVALTETEQPEALSQRLKSSRRGLFSKLKDLFRSQPAIDQDTLEELEAILVGSDLGVELTNSLIAELKAGLTRGENITEEMLTRQLKQRVLEILEQDAPLDSSLSCQKAANDPRVIMMVGVNGVGKTTTCAKLAHKFKNSGARVLLVAADTFRAAAVAQLKEWGNRLEVPVVHGEENAKPATVVFDAMQRAKTEDFDVVLIDTAGRLHTKSNLMQELEGVKNTIQKHVPLAPHETILVVDGTTGQNAIQQAREFHQATPLTGLIVTKLDGTPKGGIVAAIKSEMGIPVRYIGVGESQLDLRPFVPRDFVEALFDSSELSETREPGINAERRRRRRDTQEFMAN